ncbi:MAG: flagellar hook-length control protein FliK [Gammaproteobacteria bacterium]|nr:flagellar hook-length control protein FliK [Gammaproteobacteria bacterium]MBU1415447.1 flagellar hook-length control protein FliK [Gammaproteobacteria bacterium]
MVLAEQSGDTTKSTNNHSRRNASTSNARNPVATANSTARKEVSTVAESGEAERLFSAFLAEQSVDITELANGNPSRSASASSATDVLDSANTNGEVASLVPLADIRNTATLEFSAADQGDPKDESLQGISDEALPDASGKLIAAATIAAAAIPPSTIAATAVPATAVPATAIPATTISVGRGSDTRSTTQEAGIGSTSSKTALATAFSASPTKVDSETGAENNALSRSVVDAREDALARERSGQVLSNTNAVPAKLAVTEAPIARPEAVLAVKNADGAVTGGAKAGISVSTESVAMAISSFPGTATTQINRPVGEFSISVPAGSAHWESAIGNSLIVMHGSRHDRADLILNPPQLGRIEVSISMKGDEATASFIAANPTVRDALENAMPRLREILADAGIALGQTHIGAESQNQSAKNPQYSEKVPGGPSNDVKADGSLQDATFRHDNTPLRGLSNKLIDTYA